MRQDSQLFDQVLSPDGDAEPPPSAVAKGDGSPFFRMLRSRRAGGINLLPKTAPGLLETGVPGRSALKGARPFRRKGPVRIGPSAPSPTPGTLRLLKNNDPKMVVSLVGNEFLFPPKWANERAKKVRAH